MSESTSGQSDLSILRRVWRLGRTKIGLAILVIVIAIALVGPIVAPFSPTEFVDLPNTPSVPGTLFGTDFLGQDVWSRFLLGGRSILLLAAVSTAIGVSVGAILGTFSAYVKGRLSSVIMRAFDIIIAFPGILWALLLVSMLGSSNTLIVLATVISTVPRVGRIIYGAAVAVVERDFVAAATALGESRMRVVFREILPNVTAPLLVEINLRFTYSIGGIASLAFLGFTADPVGANWGTMIQENSVAIVLQPWGVVLPVVAIALLTIGTGLIGDALSRVSAGIDRGRDE
jgi:peptide/nickel transport system permease protein